MYVDSNIKKMYHFENDPAQRGLKNWPPPQSKFFCSRMFGLWYLIHVPCKKKTIKKSLYQSDLQKRPNVRQCGRTA